MRGRTVDETITFTYWPDGPDKPDGRELSDVPKWPDGPDCSAAVRQGTGVRHEADHDAGGCWLLPVTPRQVMS